MRFRRWLALLCLVAVGCARSDADALGRIGELLWQKSKALPQAGPNGRLVQAITGTDGDIVRQVESSLRNEPALANLSIRVEHADGRMRLTGQGVGDDQRVKAMRIAEAAAGAGKVEDAMER